MRHFFVAIFASVILPIFSIVFPLLTAALIANRHNRNADASIAMLRRAIGGDNATITDLSDAAPKVHEIKKEASRREWREGLMILAVIIAAEIFIAYNWHAIGRAMFGD